MRPFDFTYQRTIIAYHGCSEKVAQAVLSRGEALKASENDYDWLGRGIYFWEHGPQRAVEWAGTERGKHRQTSPPSVLGALIHLGNCFDLLDTRATELLTGLYPVFDRAYRKKHLAIPKNDPKSGRNYLDCAVINWAIDFLEHQAGQRFHSVRGLFVEGPEVFVGSAIKAKSHIQIAIRDPSAIIGYFKPALDKSALSNNHPNR